MDLDEVKALWQETNRRLEAMAPALNLQARLTRSATADRTRSKLRFVRLVLWYEATVGGLAVLFAGSYLADHISAMRFALPAAVLTVGAILMLAHAARQLVALHQIDFTGPVLAIQHRLAELRLARARSNRGLLLSAPLLWALLIVVVPHGLVGLDVYRAVGVPWVAANFGVGLAVLGLAAWIGQRVSTASPITAFVGWIGDDLTGRTVREASGLLDELVAYDTEP